MINEMIRAEIWLQDTLGTASGLEELAHRMGYSPSQIRRRFRDVFGLSPGAYRDQLRLAKAARLLVQTPLSVKSISATCGYRNHSAFTRAFQKYHGKSPRRYRQQRQLDLCIQQQGQASFAYQIDELPSNHAVLTRLYNTSLPLDNTSEWKQYLQSVPSEIQALDETVPIVILQDETLGNELPRFDIGVQVEPESTRDLALPPTFRLLQLPRQRHARLHLSTAGQLSEAMRFMSYRSLSGEGEALSGEPPHLIPRAEGFELRIPLC
ncbi:helix-turn-helix transcriptional regulator [Halomonas sp. I1]|uniref:helix-turn-helix transcriptional regulator n=1 Tax=Halomonas sp. I1 TaxID=393536 RepID=UPI0028DF4B47|nr:helix-turn-helix transcriptional regulator [Halomonas sp. I1]MDT8893628.1 helix-turn-helix transcriptional regulator [Halomonas sp. I1]